MILVTGIQKNVVETMLERFNSYTRRSGEITNYKLPIAKICAYNNFWINIETCNEDAAGMLKKFLRN